MAHMCSPCYKLLHPHLRPLTPCLRCHILFVSGQNRWANRASEAVNNEVGGDGQHPLPPRSRSANPTSPPTAKPTLGCALTITVYFSPFHHPTDRADEYYPYCYGPSLRLQHHNHRGRPQHMDSRQSRAAKGSCGGVRLPTTPFSSL